MAKGYTILPNGEKLLFGWEAGDIPDLSAKQITSDELAPAQLPTKGIEYGKLSYALIEQLVEEAERELALARELAGITEVTEVRANEKYGLANIEVR